MKKIRVIELFAGVGGFRLGLEGANDMYEIVWSNQWEPGASTQHASEIYVNTWGPKNHSNQDIQEVIDKNFKEIPNHDLLVGGFPCQDYSVARTLNQAKGIMGKKGVLWWSIYNILKMKGKDSPGYLFLENVDRLLKSPAAQRGRDFAVMLASLSKLGYAVEWRVINAADYGMPQRRRRTLILGYKKGTNIFQSIEESLKSRKLSEWLLTNSTGAKAFPIEIDSLSTKTFEIKGSLSEVSSSFSADKPTKSPFEIAGIMINGKVVTCKVTPKYKGPYKTLGDIIIKNEKKISEEFFIKEEDIEKWKILKGKKSEWRESKSKHKYKYSEGAMLFPDDLLKPSRTIVTGEGGSGPSRFKHVIQTSSGRLRRLTPEELERLDMFPPNHTKFMLNNKQTPDTKRAFIVGNALVVGVIKRFGEVLAESIEESNK